MTWRRWILAAAMGWAANDVAAQGATPALPEYTNEQRWGRQAALGLSQLVSEIELGKARGMTVDEIGKWLGAYYASTWAGGLDARMLATSMRWNMLSHPQAQVEMTTFSDTLVVMRANAPDLAAFGADRRFRSVTFDEYRTVYQHVNRLIAEQVGVRMDQRSDGDWTVYTLRNGYEPLRASDAVRWGRAAFVLRVVTLDVIRTGEAAGMSPRDVGLAAAKTWEGTWSGTDSPWRLFRGMAWNNFTDPESACEILAASATQVRGRCNRPWLATVRANAQRTAVTVEDYEAYQLGLEQGIAASLGMTWDVVLEGDARIITVRRR